MSRRSLIGEALAAPAPDDVPASEAKDAAGASAPRNFTTRRLEGFTEAARMVKRPTIRLKPSECSIWPGNARDYERLTEARLHTLIASIQAENGNRIPVVVRRKPQGAQQYELIIGTRRHWAVAWLNANHYPDIELVAIIEDLDDEAAFRLADIENREREDISDLERGLNYKAAVDFYYDGLQARLAERVKISKSTLARYIGLTEIPQTIVSAFASPMDLQVRHGDKLLPVLRNPSLRPRMEEAARQLAAEQSFRQSDDEEPIVGSQVVARLLKAVSGRPRRAQKATIEAGGAPIGIVERDRARGLTITLNPTELSTEAILNALRPFIENAKILKRAAP